MGNQGGCVQLQGTGYREQGTGDKEQGIVEGTDGTGCFNRVTHHALGFRKALFKRQVLKNDIHLF